MLLFEARPNSKAMISVKHGTLFRVPLVTRMPFRYGIATMDRLPHLIMQLSFEIDGELATGVAADHLVPKWFTKDPSRAIADEIEDLLAVVHVAYSHSLMIRGKTPFGFCHQLHTAQRNWGVGAGLPPLLVNFGSSLVERCLLDAFCRAKALTLQRAIHGNALGIDLGLMHASLTGTSPGNWLPSVPPSSVAIRHTVGLSDPIENADIGTPIADGLPQSLAQAIGFYGLDQFKIKIDADIEQARTRLVRIERVLTRECHRGFNFSLDGNEGFHDATHFAQFMIELFGVSELSAFWKRLMFIEQPLHREVALLPASNWNRIWSQGRPPIIIDESDGALSDLPKALELGYAGVSHKNCKGVLKGIANACLLAQRRSAGHPAILCGEDLSNIGPVALLQDLAVQVILGVASIERNGHHYFAGLSQFPQSVQDSMMSWHSDIYVRSAKGWPRVNVQSGRLSVSSALDAPFGFNPRLDLSVLPGVQL